MPISALLPILDEFYQLLILILLFYVDRNNSNLNCRKAIVGGLLFCVYYLCNFIVLLTVRDLEPLRTRPNRNGTTLQGLSQKPGCGKIIQEWLYGPVAIKKRKAEEGLSTFLLKLTLSVESKQW